MEDMDAMTLNKLFRKGDQSVEAMALRFKAARTAFGISTNEMAHMSGRGSTTITNTEKARQRPSPEAVSALYSRTGVDFNFIYIGDYRQLSAEALDLVASAAKLISSHEGIEGKSG